jgi:hypothetical protein
MNSERHDRRIDSLILDLLEWLATEPRSYSEVIDAWGTSCAKLPVWEEAVDRGLVASELATPAGVLVRVRPAGHMLLSEQHDLTRARPAGGIQCRLDQKMKPRQAIQHQDQQTQGVAP